jgi:GTP-binding protein
LFCTLDASDEILDYPIYYASAKNGWAVTNMNDEKIDMKCILDGIINNIP